MLVVSVEWGAEQVTQRLLTSRLGPFGVPAWTSSDVVKAKAGIVTLFRLEIIGEKNQSLRWHKSRTEERNGSARPWSGPTTPKRPPCGIYVRDEQT